MNTKPFARTSWSRSRKQLTRVAVGLCAFALASSVLATPRSAEVGPAGPISVKGTQVVLLALDGVRYEDVFRGVDAKLSAQQRLERVAASSGRVAVSTGRRAGRTRSGFERTPAARAALRRAEDEAPWPGHGDFRRDRFTAELALAYLEEARPELLFIGLGEPDEFAHQGNYAGYLDSLRHADERIGQLAKLLAFRAASGVRTALFVTADHGRGRNFRDQAARTPGRRGCGWSRPARRSGLAV